MSFLNPVSLPVKRFKSTDAGAPQIKYNARVAGDVKAVLKACLVDGYGATVSAGWTAANEVDDVIEFVSPSAAMSDYRLGVDDSTAANTVWYYQYQDARINPSYNNPTKAFTFSDNAHASNGWQLLVTERGIVFIEIVQHTGVNKLSTRITYWGQVKSGLPSVGGQNICFFNIGHNAAITSLYYFYSTANHAHTMLENNTSAYMSAATSYALSGSDYELNTSSIDLVSEIYLANITKNMLIAQLPPMLSKIVNAAADMYGVDDKVLNSRNVLSVCAGFAASISAYVTERSRSFLIYTDYWEY